MSEYKHWTSYEDYILNNPSNTRFYYNNNKDMESLMDYFNKTVDENIKLEQEYDSLKRTKNIIAEKLMDYQRIAMKYNLISSTELEWLLDKIFNENPSLKDEIEKKHLREYMGID